MKRLLFFFFLCYASGSFAQLWVARDSVATHDSIRLFFIGDVMQHAPQIKGAWDKEAGNYNYMPCFRYIAPYWQAADYVIGNLETTLGGRDFSGYPQFCAPWQLARDLRRSGVDILTTCNNHSCDKGAAGIRNTIHYLDSLQIPHTGTFTDTTSWIAGHPIYIRQGHFKIALLSYTYGTNGIPATNGQVVSLVDTCHIAREIEKARLDTATNIVVCMHWGIEYATIPNAEQRLLAAFIHKAGADIVIGSHPHVVQPLEYCVEGNDTTGVTVYSLGNFVSNQSKRYTNGGIGVSLSLTREKGKTRYRMQYLSSYVYRPVEADGVRHYYVVPEPEVSAIPDEQEAFRLFFDDTDAIIKGAVEKLR